MCLMLNQFLWGIRHVTVTFLVNLGIKTILYLKYNRINGLVGVQNGTASVNMDNQWSKQEACFAHAAQVWLAVNHNTSVTSGE